MALILNIIDKTKHVIPHLQKPILYGHGRADKGAIGSDTLTHDKIKLYIENWNNMVRSIAFDITQLDN